MMKITKKRVVLFLLFIFPLICFLLLSTGINNFTKLPVVTKNVVDVSTLDPSKTLKDNITVLCFLGNEMNSNKGGLFNLNEKIYKKFIDYKNFQIIAIYPESKHLEAQELKKEIGLYTNMQYWKFIGGSNEEINSLFLSFNSGESLTNNFSSKAYLVDKNGDLRGRINDKDIKGGKLFGYNMRSVSELKNKMKDDVNVLFYEYYAAFKERNENKADRKEIGS